ncbi:MAG: tRNA pseudouridine(55) synthase TruB [Cyanobacteria bacterium]|nr:tRNA pseudouridine(55) synthase TruB [Cyanobacteriota bacterium]MDW8202124.1 tRNA pseudouridine(55) synthase TruB [Cyanobacteriota bacterium SKYGB_h_bin112]
MQGFLNVNKPAGITSHDCVAQLRKVLKIRQIGHGGTLDPAAVGVLPIAVGKATRLLQFLPPEKAYRAVIRFGLRTTTDDLEGEVMECRPTPTLSLEQVQTILPAFLGTIQQLPPRYSAIQVGGQRLYTLARSGIDIEVPPRLVEIYRLDVLDWRAGDFPELEVAIHCSSGTYIRSIARDMGDLLQTGGTLAALTRTHSGGFCLADSIALEAITDTTPLIGPELALAHLPAITLSAQEAQRWGHGQRLARPPQPGMLPGACRVLDENDRFLGIGDWQSIELGWRLQPKVVYG